MGEVVGASVGSTQTVGEGVIQSTPGMSPDLAPLPALEVGPVPVVPVVVAPVLVVVITAALPALEVGTRTPHAIRAYVPPRSVIVSWTTTAFPTVSSYP